MLAAPMTPAITQSFLLVTESTLTVGDGGPGRFWVGTTGEFRTGLRTGRGGPELRRRRDRHRLREHLSGGVQASRVDRLDDDRTHVPALPRQDRHDHAPHGMAAVGPGDRHLLDAAHR